MTGNFWTDWLLITVSLFNTIVLLWLGLTVLLNADRRTLGVWLMGGGLMMGAVFFISHTAILGSDPIDAPVSLNFWWQVGWIPVILSPFAWYVLILWYSGYWSDQDQSLLRRHRVWLMQLIIMAAIILGLMIFAHPLPSFTELAALDLSSALTIGGIPVLFVLFPVFTVLCIGLSLDALGHPASSERLMGDLARQRTRPWLIAAGVMLLVVGMLVTGFVIWVVQSARTLAVAGIPYHLMQAAIWFDLVIESLIALAAVVMGQAIVSYEVFTGRTLPRRGFFRHWRSAVILAGGYSVVIGWSLAAQHRPIYSLLLTTAVMTTFYAMFSWRSFAERENFVSHLRPFVNSQQLMKQLIAPADENHSRAEMLFAALCIELLNTRHAQLVPLGPLAPLVGAPLSIPVGSAVADLPAEAQMRAGSLLMTLDDGHPYRWAIPLWTERGLIGALLLGEKQDRSLYTQEEIEIARTSGERLIDMLAGEEMSRRLMRLQRQHLAETQVMDRRTRRALHDEVLPSLHTAILRLSGSSQGNEAVQEAISVLSESHHQISNLIRTSPNAELRDMESVGFVRALRNAIESEFAGEIDSITWNIESEPPPLEPLAMEVLFHSTREAVRNAARHGRGANREGALDLTIMVRSTDRCAILITDNGVGIPQTPVDDEGGLALHATLLAIIGGQFEVTAQQPVGTRVTLSVPLKQVVEGEYGA